MHKKLNERKNNSNKEAAPSVTTACRRRQLRGSVEEAFKGGTHPTSFGVSVDVCVCACVCPPALAQFTTIPHEFKMAEFSTAPKAVHPALHFSRNKKPTQDIHRHVHQHTHHRHAHTDKKKAHTKSTHKKKKTYENEQCYLRN
jgi:hypothetical protein